MLGAIRVKLELWGEGNSVAEPGIFQVFEEADCESLVVSCGDVVLSRPMASRILESMKDKRATFPRYFEFAAAYPGRRKRKVALWGLLNRVKGVRFAMYLGWHMTAEDPPPEMGKVSKLFECLAPVFGERQVGVSARFAYERDKVGSIFRPIRLAEGSTIFDEIVGFSGTKRDPQGKLLYTLEVEMGQKRLTHVVRFEQAVKLVEELPLFLIPSAKRVSALALERGGK